MNWVRTLINHNNKLFKQHSIFEFKVSGVKIIDSTLIPFQTKYSLSFCSIPFDHSISDIETEAVYDAFEKMKLFLEVVFDDVVIFDASNKDDILLAVNVNNNIMMVDGAPTDQKIFETLHCKLNALVGDYLVIGDISGDTSQTGLTFVYGKSNKYTLAETVDSYAPGDYAHIKPWWERNDSTTFEIPLMSNGQPSPYTDFLEGKKENKHNAVVVKWSPSVITTGEGE